MTRLVVFIGFCVAFAAGWTVGLTRHRAAEQQSISAPPATTRSIHRGRGFLESELNLTAQQKEQLNTIWSDIARGGRGDHENRRQELRDKRDSNIAALIRPEDKPKYEQALQSYRDGVEAMDREVRDRFRKAVEATKAVLTTEQRAKSEQILSRHPFGPSSGGPPGRDRGGRDRETTRRSEPAH